MDHTKKKGETLISFPSGRLEVSPALGAWPHGRARRCLGTWGCPGERWSVKQIPTLRVIGKAESGVKIVD